jgi:DNA-3-methyladenine glycosylase I
VAVNRTARTASSYPDGRSEPQNLSRNPSSASIGDNGLARPAWATTSPLLRVDSDTEWGQAQFATTEACSSGSAWKRCRPACPGHDPAQPSSLPRRVRRIWSRQGRQYGSADIEWLLVNDQISVIAANPSHHHLCPINHRTPRRWRTRQSRLVVCGLLVSSGRFSRTAMPRRYPTWLPESPTLAALLRRRGFADVGSRPRSPGASHRHSGPRRSPNDLDAFVDGLLTFCACGASSG